MYYEYNMYLLYLYISTGNKRTAGSITVGKNLGEYYTFLTTKYILSINRCNNILFLLLYTDNTSIIYIIICIGVL